MNDVVSIISMNCQGLGDKSKRKDVINFLKGKQYSICMLQDTHFLKSEENYIRSLWGYECFFSSFNSQSRGVAILVNNTFEFKISGTEQDLEGNLLILSCKICDKNITLVNIYGPNRDNPSFYQNLHDRMSKYENSCYIIGGDFNLILNPNIDSYNYVNLNNPNARDSVFNIISEYNLLDCWRENHMENLEYTWQRRNPIKKARLDFFLTSDMLFTDLEDSRILHGYRTDHALIYIALKFGKFKKGTSYWKFNNSLLKDQTYIAEIKKIITETKLQYALDIPENYNDINTIPCLDLTFSISDQMFFEMLLLAIRGKTISFSSHKKKLQINKENILLKEIEQIEKQRDIDYENLESKKNELADLRKKKMEGVFIRSKAKWIQEGEKPTKYFCNLENRHYVSKLMNSLKTNLGEILTNQDEILKETKAHYENLYKVKRTEDVSLPRLLSNMNVPKLSNSETQSIEGLLTPTEMLNSLKRMSNNTSPGNDGFTVEFYKFFWSDVGIFLVRSINNSYTTGELSITQKQGVITCIPKGDKDKALLKNWRPISLLNMSYKIASSSIAFRIKNILGNIINEDQTGFLPGRLMATNIRQLYDLLFYTEKHNIPGLLLLIDFAAAFDTVSWSFMIKSLEFFNFGPSIIQWVKLFYTNIESCVIVNGHMSEWFSLQRGCRQGDALSPYLFIICAEILSILLRNNPNIKGIKINRIEYLVSQYADDTSLTLDGSKESLEHTLQVLKFYGNISGLNMNTDKTKVIWFGSRKNSNTILCPQYNLTWENSIFTVLGVKFSTNLSDMIKINYSSKIEEIKKLFCSWSKRMISPIGKITVIKTLALAKLNHLILGIPNPPQEEINKIQNLCYKFIWNNSNDRVKRSTLTQSYKYGGLKMIDINLFMNSLKLTWLRRLLTMDNKCSHLAEIVCPSLKLICIFGNDYIKRKLQDDQNPFWRDVLNSFLILSSSISPLNSIQANAVNMWYNPEIKVGGSSVYYKRWFNAGITFLGDLVNPVGEFYTFREFLNTYNIRTHFLEFNGIIAALKKYMNKKGITTLSHKTYNPPIPLGYITIIKDKKGCKSIYLQIKKKQEFPKSLQKWTEDLRNIPNAIVLTEPIYDITFRVTKDPKLLWFQYRINHRILATNYLLKKMNITMSDDCTFCRNSPETLMHLFWNCDVCKRFWGQLSQYVNSKCNTSMPNWKLSEILFGSKKLDSVINYVILQAKHFIYYSRIIKQIPMFEIFKKRLRTFYHIERYNALKQFQIQKFEATWEKYKNLFAE